jgi:hypothetical protein
MKSIEASRCQKRNDRDDQCEHHDREHNGSADFILLGFVVIVCHGAKIVEWHGTAISQF